MSAPAIVGISMPHRPVDFALGGCVALLTVDFGPLLVRGLQLMVSDKGTFFLAPPRMHHPDNRFVFKNGPERDSVLAEAVRLSARFLENRSAVSPVATAPDHLETIA